MTTKILALADALGNFVRLVLLPGQRYDTVGVPRLIDGFASARRSPTRRSDSNTIIAEPQWARRQDRRCPASAPRLATRRRQEMYKWRHLIENFLLQSQRIQTDRATGRQDRSELHRHDPPRRRRDTLTIDPNRL